MAKQTRCGKLQDQIYERIVERGEPLEQVEEELIDAAGGLPADYRAGLWLYAWSLQSAAHQRYEALRFLAQFEGLEQTD